MNPDMPTSQEPQNPSVSPTPQIPQTQPTNPLQMPTSGGPSQPPLPPQPPKGFAWGQTIVVSLGVLGAGLAIAFGGFYLGQRSAMQNTIAPTPSSMATPSALPTAVPTQASPSGQLTYTDTTYGISFSYPGGWEVSHMESLNGYWLRIAKKGQNQNISGPIVLEINPSTTGQTPILQNYLTKEGTATTQQVQIAGENGYFQTHANCEPYACNQYVFAKGTTAYLLKSYTPEKEADQDTTFTTIARTFVFTK